MNKHAVTCLVAIALVAIVGSIAFGPVDITFRVNNTELIIGGVLILGALWVVSSRKQLAVKQEKEMRDRRDNQQWSEGRESGLNSGKEIPNGKPIWDELPTGTESYLLKAQFPYRGRRYYTFVGQTNGGVTTHSMCESTACFVPGTDVQTHKAFVFVTVLARRLVNRPAKNGEPATQEMRNYSERLLIRSDDKLLVEHQKLPEVYYVDGNVCDERTYQAAIVPAEGVLM